MGKRNSVADSSSIIVPPSVEEASAIPLTNSEANNNGNAIQDEDLDGNNVQQEQSAAFSTGETFNNTNNNNEPRRNNLEFACLRQFWKNLTILSRYLQARLTAIQMQIDNHLHNFFSNPARLRIHSVIIMQLIAIAILIWNGAILYRELNWNKVVEGEAPIMISGSKKYIKFSDFDDPQLKNYLKKDATPLISVIILLTILLVFNGITISLERSRKRWFHYAAMCYAVLGLSLQIVALFQLILALFYHQTQNHDYLLQRIEGLIPEGESPFPRSLPQNEMISLREDSPFLLQVFQSCREWGIEAWQKKNEMLYVNSTMKLKVPNYSELVDMGFCLDGQANSVSAVLVFCFLSPLIWWNASMCLTIYLEQPKYGHDSSFDLESMSDTEESGETDTGEEDKPKGPVLVCN